MKKINIRIVLFLIVATMGRLFADGDVFSEGDFVYTVENGSAHIFAYVGGSENISIPSSLGGYAVTSISGTWVFYGQTASRIITIPSSVTSIGDGMFTGCSDSTTFDIPDSVTIIGEWVISACSNITVSKIPKSITSIGKITFVGSEGQISSDVASVEVPNNEVYSWYESLPDIRTKTDDLIPASVIVKVVLGYAIEDNTASSEITARRVEIQDYLRRYFTSKTIKELTPQNEAALKLEIKNDINDILTQSAIKDVLFSMFEVIEQ